LIGEAVIEPNRERTLHVASVLPLEEDIAELPSAEEAERGTFWTTRSLEDLAELQRVAPVADLDSIGALWPADDDPDRMLAYILDERSARRRIAQEG
jgi:hypothetical protein